MATVGTVTLTYADTSTEVVTGVNVRANAAAYDRRMFRSPYGERWLVEGSGKREPEQFTLACEVWADSIEEAAPLVTDLLEKLAAAVSVTAPVGAFDSAGIVSYTQSPIEAGYRLEVVMLAESGRLASG